MNDAALVSHYRQQIADATAEVPEGYRLAANTLPNQIKLMVDGLHCFNAERMQLQIQVLELKALLREANDVIALATVVLELDGESVK